MATKTTECLTVLFVSFVSTRALFVLIAKRDWFWSIRFYSIRFRRAIPVLFSVHESSHDRALVRQVCTLVPARKKKRMMRTATNETVGFLLQFPSAENVVPSPSHSRKKCFLLYISISVFHRALWTTGDNDIGACREFECCCHWIGCEEYRILKTNDMQTKGLDNCWRRRRYFGETLTARYYLMSLPRKIRDSVPHFHPSVTCAR